MTVSIEDLDPVSDWQMRRGRAGWLAIAAGAWLVVA